MALENASYISQLVSSNPVSTDSVAQADDHLRLIKGVLKATFPNLNGAVNATPAQLNGLVTGGVVPSGAILVWSGSLSTIPSGYLLCDGANGTPDLRDRFILGAGGSYLAGTTGGAVTSGLGGSHSHTLVAAGSHSHTGVTGGTALTVGQLPSHSHTLSGDSTAEDNNYTPGSTLMAEGSLIKGTYSYTTSSVGSGETHNHVISTDGSHTHTVNDGGEHSHTILPPYFALCFIMKA